MNFSGSRRRRGSILSFNCVLFVFFLLLWISFAYIYVGGIGETEKLKPLPIQLNNEHVPEIDELFNIGLIRNVDEDGRDNEKTSEKKSSVVDRGSQSEHRPRNDDGSAVPLESSNKGDTETRTEPRNDDHEVVQLSDQGECVKYLLENDMMDFPRRDYKEKPVRVFWRNNKVREECDVPCHYIASPVEGKTADGIMSAIIFGGRNALKEWNGDKKQKKIILGMESASNYQVLNVKTAKSQGYDITMTTDLNSDVPSPYFSWAEYAFLSKLSEKTQPSIAAAFISNCGVGNVARKRLQVMKELQENGVTVDSYGKCNHNKAEDRSVPKTDILRTYKFYLAFENTNEPDYVTEKFFQALDAGTVPISIAPDDIDDFAPNNHSIVNINSYPSVKEAADFILKAANDSELYESLVDWKYKKPSERFYAMVDLSSVHSQCRLCVKLADYSDKYEEEENSDKLLTRPCKCRIEGEDTTVYHLYVRERSTYYYKDIFISKPSLTELYAAVYKEFADHVPRWANEKTRGTYKAGEFKIYSIYEWKIDLTPRKQLFGDVSINTDEKLSALLNDVRCPKLEVIFI